MWLPEDFKSYTKAHILFPLVFEHGKNHVGNTRIFEVLGMLDKSTLHAHITNEAEGGSVTCPKPRRSLRGQSSHSAVPLPILTATCLPQAPLTLRLGVVEEGIRVCFWEFRPDRLSWEGFIGTPTGGGPSRDWRVAWGKNCCRFGGPSWGGVRLGAARLGAAML
jgi:hypothetical protein